MGGLAKHISHVYENNDLRFYDIKDLFRNVARGKLEVYEKFDGQNLFVTWDFFEEKLKVARNKTNIRDGGLDRYGLSLKFGDRPEIERLFTEAYDAISESFEGIDHNKKSEIFGMMGGIWFSIEIINPELPNTILYDKKRIIFHKHGPTYFGHDAEPIETSLERNLEALEEVIPDMNAASSWEVSGPNELELDEFEESEIAAFCKEIDDIYSNDQISLRVFAFKCIRADMERFPLIPKDVRIDIARNLTKHPSARSMKKIVSPLDKFTKDQVSQMVKMERDNLAKLLKPIEDVIHRFSCRFLSGLESEFIPDIDSESERIKMEFERCCNIIADTDKAEWLQSMMKKIGPDRVAIEGVVFVYKDRLYKFTGNFAPMNRVIANVKYSNKERESNRTNASLAGFITI
jgi:hypothetical protein